MYLFLPKKLCISFDKKRLGLHFGRIFSQSHQVILMPSRELEQNSLFAADTLLRAANVKLKSAFL
jgi:hypothetical protein